MTGAPSLQICQRKNLKKLDESSPWGEEKERVRGWEVVMEIHNRDFHPLIWWYGRLFHLRDAPRLLNNKFYNKYTGKYTRETEWTLVKGIIEKELKYLDKEYKRIRAKEYRLKKKENAK
jgi:hypothetical protein